MDDINFADQGNRILIIAPLITLANWVNEFSKWSISDSQNVLGEVFNVSGLYIWPANICGRRLTVSTACV